MKTTRIMRALSKLTRIAAAVALLATAGVLCTSPTVHARQDASVEAIVRNVMIGEFAMQSGDPLLAWKHFMLAAQKTRDPLAASRALDAAEATDNEKAAEQALALWTQLDPDNSRVRLTKTEEAFATGNFEEAQKLARSIIDEADNIWAALEALSGFEEITSEKTKFYETFRDLTADNQDDPRVQLLLSSLAGKAKMRPQAAEHAVRAMDLAPSNPHVLMQGVDAQFANDPKGASARLKKFLSQHPDNFEVRLVYAKSLMKLGDKAGLDKELTALESPRRDNARSMLILGMIAEEGRLYDRAERLYKRYLYVLAKTDKPGDLIADTAYVRLGMVKLAQGHRELAVEWLHRVQAGDKYEASHIKEAEILAEIGRIDEACTALKSIRTENKARATALNTACADLLLKAGRASEAVDALVEIVKTGPENIELTYRAAMLAEQNNRFDAARELLEFFVAKWPENPNGHNSLGYLMLIHDGDMREAEHHIMRAVQLSGGNDPFITDSLGWLRYLQGKTEEAETLLRRAQDARPSDTEVTLHLAEVLYVRGKTHEAEGFVRGILASEPNNKKAKSLLENRGPAKPPASGK